MPGTPVLSFGTAGCNLACQFCQNWDISKSQEVDTLSDEASPEKIARAAYKLGCRSVAYTYNDPVIFMEYAIDVARACREYGLKSVAVTAGYITDKPREEFFRYMDAGQCGPESIYGRLLLQDLRRSSGVGARDPEISQGRNRYLVRDHDASDSRSQ